MSGPTADPRSLARRMRFTPLRDALRGRFSGRLDARHVIESAGLPGALASIAHEVVRRTRLRRSEKVDVARELVAHFRDALDAGHSAESIAGAFGDARLAARLIRRGKKRARGPMSKAAGWTGRAIGVVLLFAIVWYAWAAVLYFTGEPNVAVDYVARINARALALPEGERAWLDYRAAYLAIPDRILADQAVDSLTSARPGDEAWPRAVAAIKAVQGPLDRVREASKKPGLGMVFGVRRDPMLVAKGEGVQRLTAGVPVESGRVHAEPEPPASTREIPVINLLFEHVGPMRSLALFLALDTRVALHQEKPERAVEDLGALCRLADHSLASDTLIAQLVSVSIYNVALAETNAMLAGYADLPSSDQLSGLAHALAGYQGGSISLNLEGERVFFLDTVQRVFSDDGSGGGRICAKGMREFGLGGSFFELISQDDSLAGFDAETDFLGPVVAFVSAPRKELVETFERFMAMAEREAAAPLEGHAFADAMIEELFEGPLSRARYWFMHLLAPAIGRASTNLEIVAQQRDATLTAIALELYKRRHGAYPDALDALVPTFLPAVPPDRYTGEPLNYMLDPGTGRPILYSVGVDRDDDGGRSTVDEEGDRDDFPGRLGASAEQVASWDEEKRRRYDGDWILFPPAPEAH